MINSRIKYYDLSSSQNKDVLLRWIFPLSSTLTGNFTSYHSFYSSFLRFSRQVAVCWSFVDLNEQPTIEVAQAGVLYGYFSLTISRSIVLADKWNLSTLTCMSRNKRCLNEALKNMSGKKEKHVRHAHGFRYVIISSSYTFNITLRSILFEPPFLFHSKTWQTWQFFQTR